MCMWLVVYPIIALMQDQVKAITAMEISATHITDRAEFQIISISREALVGGREWSSMLDTDVYQNHQSWVD